MTKSPGTCFLNRATMESRRSTDTVCKLHLLVPIKPGDRLAQIGVQVLALQKKDRDVRLMLHEVRVGLSLLK